MASARTVLWLALFVLSAVVVTCNPLILQGRVFCDTCRAGFETPFSTYISDAQVRVECRDRNTMQVLYSVEGVTDSSGTYKISVTDGHEDEFCDAVLVSSPQADCKMVEPGRDRTRVILSRDNGIVSEKRYANSLGFMKEQASPGCIQLFRGYMGNHD